MCHSNQATHSVSPAIRNLADEWHTRRDFPKRLTCRGGLRAEETGSYSQAALERASPPRSPDLTVASMPFKLLPRR